jgi:transporter family protein
MWLLYAFLSSIFAAAVAIFGKLGLKTVDSTLATAIRAVIMATFLFLVALTMRKFDGFNFHSLSGKDWLLIVLSGVAGALSWLFYFFALKYGIVILLAALFLGEGLTWRSITGAIMIAGGAYLITLK